MSLSMLKSALSRLRLAEPPQRIIELGAGDGTLLLRLARALHPRWAGIELVLLDRQPAVSAETLEDYRRLGWRASVAPEDVLRWARTSDPHASDRRTSDPRASDQAAYDLCVTTLFLHHFLDPDLRVLLRGVAVHSRAFIALEPRREALATLGSHLIGLLGTSPLTRADAVKSVAAGFTRQEITAAWPRSDDWWTQEFRALPFSHGFIAARADTRRPNA